MAVKTERERERERAAESFEKVGIKIHRLGFTDGFLAHLDAL